MRNLLQDLRYAIRALSRTPGFTLVAVFTLALGIGANTAIFSLVHAVILKPLPFRDPSRLVAVWDTYLPLFPKLGVSPPELEGLQRQTNLFEQSAWYRYVPKDLNLIASGSAAIEVHATFISARFLPLLGVAPVLGHAFSDTESSQSVLLSHSLWTSRFGGDPAVVGRTVQLGGQQFAIVGVTGQSSGARGALVAAEFALAIVVVVGAGILVKSFLRLMHVDPGFNPNGVLTLRISSPTAQDGNALFHRLQERLAQVPGIESIAAANTLPLIANRANALRFHIPGSPLIHPDAPPVAQIRAVSPDYFHAMQIPLRSGRAFTERDLSQPVVMINETMARRFWPGIDPVGIKFITGPWGPNPNWSTIIGVAGDVKQFGLDSEATMDVYFPSLVPSYLILKTHGEPGTFAAAVQREIATMDGSLAISELRTMAQIQDQTASSRRWTMGLLTAFAGLAFLLALVGIYGVTSWAVAQRTREIGIRMAIGAEGSHILAMVLRDGTKLCAVGLTIGLAGAFAFRQFLSNLTFGVSTADPSIYVGSALLMIAAALLACYLPARRASRTDPMIALRWE